MASWYSAFGKYMLNNPEMAKDNCLIAISDCMRRAKAKHHNVMASHHRKLTVFD